MSDKPEKKPDDREKKLTKDLGHHPAFVGSAALLGGETLGKLHPASLGAQALYHLLDNSKAINPGLHGTPLDTPLDMWLSGFSAKDARAVGKFKKSQVDGKRLLMTAAPESAAMPVDIPEFRIRGRRILPEARREVFLGSTSAPVAMHEIGHATPILGGRSAALNKAWHVGIPLAQLLKYPAMAQVLAPPDEDSSSTRKFLYDNAPALVGAAYAPTLIEEARATGHALKGARQTGIGMGKALKALAPAFGTYLGTGLLPPILGTILAKKLVQYLHKKDALETEKQANMKPQGALKNSMAVAYNSTPPSPKSTPVGSGPRKVIPHQTGARVKLPSKAKFFNDNAKASMGFGGNRMGVPGIGK